MTTDLLDDLRAIERHAIAGGADDKLLARAIPLHVLLLMGVRPDAACAFLHALALISKGNSVKTACERSKLSRRRYYQLREVCTIPAHMVCEPRTKLTVTR